MVSFNFTHAPSLFVHLKAATASLSRAASLWKRRWDAGSGSILRRFLATKEGILIAHPAMLLAEGFRPEERAWFTKVWVVLGLTG